MGDFVEVTFPSLVTFAAVLVHYKDAIGCVSICLPGSDYQLRAQKLIATTRA